MLSQANNQLDLTLASPDELRKIHLGSALVSKKKFFVLNLNKLPGMFCFLVFILPSWKKKKPEM